MSTLSDRDNQMTIVANKARQRFLLLCLSLLLVLSACRIESGFTAGGDGSSTLTVEFDSESVVLGGQTCQNFAGELNMLKGIYGEATIEALPQAKGLGCKITFKDGPLLKQAIEKDEAGHITVTVPREFWSSMNSELNKNKNLNKAFTFKFTITLPEDVTEVSDGGKANGKTAEWNSYKDVEKGVSATAGGKLGKISNSNESISDSPSPSSTTTKTPTATPWTSPPSRNDEEGFPIWAWVLIGVASVAAVIAILFLVTRKKKDGNYPLPGGAFPDPSGYPGPVGHPGQGGYTDPQAYPGSGQYPGTAYQGSGPGYSAPGGYPGPGAGNPNYGTHPGSAPYASPQTTPPPGQANGQQVPYLSAPSAPTSGAAPATPHPQQPNYPAPGEQGEYNGQEGYNSQGQSPR